MKIPRTSVLPWVEFCNRRRKSLHERKMKYILVNGMVDCIVHQLRILAALYLYFT